MMRRSVLRSNQLSTYAAFACLAAAAASTVGAQGIDRSKRPIAPPPTPFVFPKIQSHTLPNGLRVLVVEDHSLPLVAVRAVLAVDSTADPAGKQGLYAVTMGSLREGTTSRSPEQLTEAAADLGAVLNPVPMLYVSGIRPTVFTATTAAFPSSLSIMGDMLMHPAFDQAGIDRQKAAQAAAARRIAQDPQMPARRILYSTLYGPDDPGARWYSLSDATIGAITRDDVQRFYDEHIGPRATTLVIAGDVTDREAMGQAEHVFGAWLSGAEPTAPQFTGNQSEKATTIYLEDKPGTQAYVYLGGLGPQRTSLDQYAVETMSTVVTARMQQVLREQHSFMYGGSMSVIWSPEPRPSALVGVTFVSATKVDSALVAWLGLIRGLSAEQPASPAELEAARRNRIGVLPARIDGPDSLASRLSDLARDRLPLDYYDQYAVHMATVSAADVAHAESKYVDPDHLVIVVTGDRKVIEPALKAANIGPVVIVN